MAEHGEGNDLPAHEAGYSQFVQAAFIGTAMVINILIGLAIGGAIGHWLPAAFVIIAGVAVAGISGWTGSRMVSLVMVAISGLLLLYNVYN